jgi:hypothetical protein
VRDQLTGRLFDGEAVVAEEPITAPTASLGDVVADREAPLAIALAEAFGFGARMSRLTSTRRRGRTP